MFELTPYGCRRVSTYNPFRDLEDMSRSFFGGSEMGGLRTDISEKDGVYTLEADLPGFKKEEISIDIDKDALTISAEHKSETEEEDKEKNFVRRERIYGSFSRSFNIKGIDTEAISAAYNDGVLTLTMPRKNPEVTAARKLEIS